MDISKKLVETHSLTKEECLELFSLFNNSGSPGIFKRGSCQSTQTVLWNKSIYKRTD